MTSISAFVHLTALQLAGGRFSTGHLAAGRVAAIRSAAVRLGSWLHRPDRLRPTLWHRPSERGQSTVEYALILLGAAAVALVVVAWVTRTDLIGRLFDTVVGRILTQAT